MKTPSPSLRDLFSSKAVTGKLFLLAFLLCFCNNLFAGIKPVYKERPVTKADNTVNKGRHIIKGTQYAATSSIKKSNTLTLPTISYNSPQTYITGTVITPLSPTSSGVAAPGYSSSLVTLGSGFVSPVGVAVDAAGNIYVADYSNNVVKKIPAGGGAPVTLGSGFYNPTGVAVDAAGNVYVADEGNNAVKKIPIGGGAPVTIGSGFKNPAGVAVDAAGNVYVADYGSNTVKMILVGGGSPVTLGSGFGSPLGVAVDAAGNVYVADFSNNAVKKIPVGGGSPIILGSGISEPAGVAVDAAGNVYVADGGNYAVKKIPVGGGSPITLGSGSSRPAGVAVDAAGNVYVSGFNNGAVTKIKPIGGYHIGPFLPAGLSFDETTGIISGTPTASSPATNYTITAYNSSGSSSATVNIKVAPSPTDANLAGLAISSGTLTPVFAAGTTNYTANVTWAITSITITPTTDDANATVQVNGTTVASGSASASLPLNSGDNIITVLVTSSGGATTKTYKITVTRIPPPTINYSGPQTYTADTAITPLVPTSSGVAAPGYSSSLGTLGSGFSYPMGVAVDAAGNIYVADFNNNAVMKIPVGGGSPITLGSGFNQPRGVAVDAAGNVYVADQSNNAVKKISAGLGGPVTIGSGFSYPAGVAVDAAGNVYVADYGNNAVKKIPVGGGSLATLGYGFNQPNGVAVDAAGNVYVADSGDNAIKEIPAGGGAPVTLGSGFYNPTGVAVDAAGNVYVVDGGNYAVKKIPVGGGSPITLGSGSSRPAGVAVDAAGNVYVSDDGNAAVKEIKPSGGYHIGPFLPAGLSFDENTGIISGTPTAASPATNYTITAYNSSGSGSATVNIKVAPFPTDANLAGLAISSGTLTPVFAAGTTNYTANVTWAITSITITPTTDDANATVQVNGTTVASGSASASLPLNSGDNIITVLVTSSGGTTTKTYNITVNRVPLPTISYSGPQTYTAGMAITPLAPTSTGVAAPGYSNSPIILGSGFIEPQGVAVDAAGNVYVADYGLNVVKKIPIGGGLPVTIGGVSGTFGVAVDAAGNVYMTGYFSDSVVKFPVGGGAPVTLGSGFNGPEGVAVDAAGNVYVADYYNNAVKKIPVGGGAPVTLGSGFNNPTGVAVDAAGNVYVADYRDNAVMKIPVGGGARVSIGSGFSFPEGVAVDAAGNVYVADIGHNALKEIPVGGGATLTLDSGLNYPNSIAVDAAGNLYVGTINAVKEIKATGGFYIGPFLPAGLSFDENTGIISGTPTAISPATNYTITAYNFNGSASATVNIKVAPSPTDASLAGLAISSGTLTPAFAAGVTNYTATVSKAITSITVTPTTNTTGATVKVDGAIVSSGSASASLPLNIGDNLITVLVTALDGTTTNTYKITVTRLALPTISYSGPQTYTAGTAITPLVPTSSGVAAPGYSSSLVTLGSGFSNPDAVAVDAAGNVYVADLNNNAVKKIPAGGGAPVTLGSGFNTPTGVAVDAAGNVYVADEGNNAVKKIPIGGGAQVTIGSGFSYPYGVAVDAAGNVYVADEGNNAVKKIPIGGGAPVAIGSGFNEPTGVAVDAAGNVYVADNRNNAVKEIPVGGGALVTLGSGFVGPLAVAVDAEGNVYVADSDNGAVKKIPFGGGAPVTLYAVYSNPSGIAVDAAGNIYVSDDGNNSLYEVKPVGGYYLNQALPPGLSFDENTGIISGTPIAASPATNYTITAYNNSSSSSATVNIKVAPSPTDANLAGLAISSGTLTPVFAAGTTNYTANVTWAITSITITPTTNDANATVQVNGTTVASGSASASLPLNFGGNIISVLVTSSGGTSTKTYKITVNRLALPTISYSGPQTYTAGMAITQLAPTSTGVAAPGYSNSPVILGSGFNEPRGVAVDAAGNVYVADINNNAIKEIPVGGGALVNLGYGFNNPTGVAVDAAGNVYVADYGNYVIKEIPASGGGTPVTLGFGFNKPTAVAVDAAGNVYVADYGNNAVKKIPVGGGAPVTLASGLDLPRGIAVDAAGNVYVADYGNNAVEKIPVGGGSPIILGSGFSEPAGVAVDAAGNVYVADFGHNALKEIPAGGGATLTLDSASNYPNSTAVDAAGNVYEATYNAVKEIKATGGFHIGPFLPAGLSFDENTGIISGTPTASSPATNYTITAYNVSGSASATVNIKVAPSPTDANLAGLAISSGTLTPAFAAGVTNYTATVKKGITSITVTPTTNTTGATVKVDGAIVSSGSASASLPLNIGDNLIKVLVTALDGTTTNTYQITVTRLALPTISYSGPQSYLIGQGVWLVPISSGEVNSYAISPALPVGFRFNKNTGVIFGTPTVVSPPTNYTVTAYNISGNASATVNIEVTASNAKLFSMHPSYGILSPEFLGKVTDYTDSVVNAVTSITVTPTTVFASATVTVNGVPVTSGAESQAIALNVGPNVITTVVTDPVSATTKTYTLTVTRAPSSVAILAFLQASNGILSPSFGGEIMNYTTTVSNAISTVTIKPTTVDPTATVTVNGNAVTSGISSPAIALNIGPNTITTIATAQDGITTKTYTITMTRAAASGIANNDAEDGILVHQGISANGDGMNDFLTIEGITNYPDNKLMIMNRSGVLVYEATGYDNSSRKFDGHSNKTGVLQEPGTYFYSLDYKANGVNKHKTGFIILKY